MMLPTYSATWNTALRMSDPHSHKDTNNGNRKNRNHGFSQAHKALRVQCPPALINSP